MTMTMKMTMPMTIIVTYDCDYDCDYDYDNDNYDDDDDNGKLCPTPFAQFYFVISKENKDRTKKYERKLCFVINVIKKQSLSHINMYFSLGDGL